MIPLPLLHLPFLLKRPVDFFLLPLFFSYKSLILVLKYCLSAMLYNSIISTGDWSSGEDTSHLRRHSGVSFTVAELCIECITYNGHILPLSILTVVNVRTTMWHSHHCSHEDSFPMPFNKNNQHKIGLNRRYI